ncbi:uncharacterized protein LY79DRAFT_588907 [Colletotrichum navitas]|uniref:Wings apart-like protein C-terminal domain-containing protein n=1 Tax=Colletotrichum navitas TaxID=681940 RepID=A0AAD8V7S1_9PEZI|nr:uncharacterized protein LY79DRAFT_588907 [Colletotrichum navitas]KAK1594710.1 hypothetical protein LY79DRAFT_588907 [Colletotrichum navitas]
MATREGPSVQRKKTTTYGKTSRKRPIHAFLDLSNGSRRASDTAQIAKASTASADHLYDLYDPPDDEPVHRSIPRRDVPPTDTIASQPDGSSNSKKRKTSVALTTKTERTRKIDSKPSAISPPARAPSNIRRAKPPFTSGTSDSLRIVKEESVAQGLEQLTTKKETEARPAALRSRIEPEVLRMTETNMQIRQALQRPSIPQPAVMKSISSTVVRDLSLSKPKKPHQTRRVRLIDQLVAQTEESSESDSGDDSEASPAGLRAKEASPATPVRSVDMTPKPSIRPKALSSTRKLRSTYGQQRTLKADESGGDSLGSQMGIDGSQRDLSPAPTMSKLTSFAFEEEEDIEEESSSKGGGIIDIHALRQAGANHRFADSMADLLDRVGTPQPPKSPSARSRRNALLELASKLRDKTFVRQFRDQGAKDALFQAIGQEEDFVSGFILLSVLLVLFTSYSVPHLVPQLQSEGIAQLASRLFDLDEDITSIASQRQSNLSRNAQSSLRALKSTIQQLDIWKGSPPTVLSPQMVALKAISVLCNGDSPAIRDILAGLTDHLFAFAEKGWEQSRAEGIEGTVGGLALSLLEGHSIAAMESDAGSRWTELYLPIVADILTAAMARPMQEFGGFETTALKLALNTTNNNPAAASAFSRGELFRELAEASVVGFGLLQHSVRQGAFSKDVYETLMLLLGVMINTTEHCPSTRRSVDSWQGRDESPLDRLIDVYLENRESADTADSVEKTSIAVAHGYLAILLGYLSLGSQVRGRLVEKSHGKGTKYLLDSIEEFMSLHQKLDTDELTTSLQNLVNELRQRYRRSE